MMTYDEVMEAIERGFIKGDKISIVRRNGKIHDYVLPGEKVEPGEIVEEENLDIVLEELKGSGNRRALAFKLSSQNVSKILT